jgi:hypothetical protein
MIWKISEFHADIVKNILLMSSINLELMEETGIKSSDIDIDPNFRFEEVIIYIILKVFAFDSVIL